ncbi:MAG: flagellar basal body-associated FliL family protein [Alphaproteobacteria bacterium]
MAEEDEELNEDVAEGEAAEESSVAGDINRKKIIMILLPLLLVIGAAVGVYFSGVADSLFGGMNPKDKKEQTTEDNGEQKEIVDTVFYDLPEMVVNLRSNDNRPGGLMRIRVSLEIEDALDIPRVEEYMPRVIDTFLIHLREIRAEELEGSAGVYRLKEELLFRVNRAVRPAKVLDIRFKQFEIH